MGNPRLIWSHFQLGLANQLKVLPIGRLPWVPVELEGIRTYVDIEVIDIIDNMNLYPTLMGIY